jgi:5,10-methylenetetrahydrofolate reductase
MPKPLRSHVVTGKVDMGVTNIVLLIGDPLQQEAEGHPGRTGEVVELRS